MRCSAIWVKFLGRYWSNRYSHRSYTCSFRKIIRWSKGESSVDIRKEWLQRENYNPHVLSKWKTYITMPKQMNKHIREYCALDEFLNNF
jgi:hypothetical protein